jgi:hypothetical protein
MAETLRGVQDDIYFRIPVGDGKRKRKVEGDWRSLIGVNF